MRRKNTKNLQKSGSNMFLRYFIHVYNLLTLWIPIWCDIDKTVWGVYPPIGRKIFLQLIELNYYGKGYGPKNHDFVTGQEVFSQQLNQDIYDDAWQHQKHLNLCNNGIFWFWYSIHRPIYEHYDTKYIHLMKIISWNQYSDVVTLNGCS